MSLRREDKSSDLENEIEELTRQYSVYYSQITELKAEQDKRVEAEKRLRMNDRNVYDYCSSKVNLEECLKAYQEKSLLAEEKENELSRTGDRSAQLKLKAELQDLEVHRNDLRAKIDFYRKQIQEFERADIVQKYQSLLMQIEKSTTSSGRNAKNPRNKSSGSSKNKRIGDVKRINADYH